MPLTADQQLKRGQGIGASEVGAVVGLNPWCGPHEIWERKTGRAPPWEDTAASLWGRYMEPAIIALWRAKTGVKVRYANRYQQTRVCPTNPLCVATPDGQIGSDTGLEVKTYGFRVAHHWGAPGTDEIPDYYLAQTTWQMAATGNTKTVVLASHDREVDEYRVRFDEELYLVMAEQVANFWADYIVLDTPPPPDHRDRCREILQRYYPRPLNKDYYPETEQANDLAIRLRDAETAAKEADKRLGQVQNEMRDHIGSRYGVQTAIGKVAWYPVAGRRTVSEKKIRALAESLGADASQLAQCYSHGPDYRVLRGYWKK